MPESHHAVFSSSELDSVLQILSPPSANAARAKDLTLKSSSKERIKAWPNTIDNKRAAKQREKQARLEQEEARQCVLDREAASLEQMRRQEIIKEATLTLFRRQEDVRKLHSTWLTSDVKREREESPSKHPANNKRRKMTSSGMPEVWKQ